MTRSWEVESGGRSPELSLSVSFVSLVLQTDTEEQVPVMRKALFPLFHSQRSFTRSSSERVRPLVATPMVYTSLHTYASNTPPTKPLISLHELTTLIGYVEVGWVFVSSLVVRSVMSSVIWDWLHKWWTHDFIFAFCDLHVKEFSIWFSKSTEADWSKSMRVKLMKSCSPKIRRKQRN